MTFYTYADNGTTRTTTMVNGQPNGGFTDVLNGTQTVTVSDMYGTLSRTVKDITGGVVGATLASETWSNADEFNRRRRVTYLFMTQDD